VRSKKENKLLVSTANAVNGVNAYGFEGNDELSATFVCFTAKISVLASSCVKLVENFNNSVDARLKQGAIIVENPFKYVER